MKKVSKEDLKTDKLQQELRKGFVWTAQHSKAVGIALVAFLVLGAGISAKTYLDEKKEEELQTQYYKAEKKFLDKKNAFQAAAAKAAQPPADPKKKDAKAPEETPAGEQASGDYQKDYGSVAGDLEKIIADAPKSKAAKMSALILADAQIEYKKQDEALATLKKVESSSKDLLSGLVQTQLGTVQANLGDCNAALSTWQKVTSNAEAKSLHPAVKLKQGLCYESLKDFAKAEQMYTEAKTEDKESPINRTVDKYLRLLQASKQQ